MGVGYIQLLAVGSEANIFNYNPNISFFKTYFRRHSNFFINNMTIQGNQVNVSRNNNLVTNNVLFKIPKDGDLFSKSYIQFTFDDFYFELFDYSNELVSTLNTDLMDLYDNYYIKINEYNNGITQIKNISIIRLNYYSAQSFDSEPIISLVSSCISDEIISLIGITENIYLQTDKDNIFYNIDLNLKYYSYNVLNLGSVQNLKTNNLFNYVYGNIIISKLKYIQIDFKKIGLSFRIAYSNTDNYLSIITLLYSQDYINFINQIKITTGYVYYSCEFNLKLYNLLLELFYVDTNYLDLEVVVDKTTSTKIVIKDNIVNKLNSMIIKKNNNTFIYLDIYNGGLTSSSKLTTMKNTIFFGNLTNEFYNDMLVKQSNLVLNLFNLNNSTISLNILIKMYVYLVCYKTDVSVQEFLKIVNDKKISTNLFKYRDDLNYFNDKLIKYFMDPNTLIISSKCFYIILYTKNVFKYFDTNYFVQPFKDNKLSQYTSTIINFYTRYNLLLGFNSHYNNPYDDFYLLISDLLFILNFYNTNKANAIIQKNIQDNYIYNNNLFEFVTSTRKLENINLQLDKLENVNLLLNKFANPLEIIYKNFLYLFITQSLSVFNIICNKTSEFIYGQNGMLTSVFDNIINGSVFPLSSYIYIYTGDLTNLCESNSSIVNNELLFNSDIIEYLLKLKNNLILAVNQYLYENKTTITYNIEDNLSGLLEQLEFTSLVKSYYKKSTSFINSIDFISINNFLNQNQNINFQTVYPFLKKNSINLNNDIMLDLFSYTDKNLFNSSFLSFVYNKIESCNKPSYRTNLVIEQNYLKFIFTVSSPLYRIYFLFTFLTKLTIEFNENKYILPIDISTLRDISFIFIITYLHYFNNSNTLVLTDKVFFKYNMNRIYNPDYLLINNFLCFDEINIFTDNNFLNNIKNSNSSEYSMLYNNFYICQKKISSIELKNLATINDIPNTCNDFKYNFDDKVIILFLSVLNDNSQFFSKYNFVYDFVLSFFDKYNFNHNKTLNILANLEESTDYINNFIANSPSDDYFYICQYTTHILGSLFDNININNVETTNSTFSLTNEYNYNGYSYNYSFLNFNIKKNNNYLSINNAISCLKYFLSKLFEIFNSNSAINYQYYQNYINTMLIYTNSNAIYFYLYLISEYNFNDCLAILQKYIGIFNLVNNSKINLSVGSNTTKYNKTNFSKYNFIVIIYYYIYFIYNCLYTDIKLYNESSLVIGKNFGYFINIKYTSNIYYDCINDLINVFVKSVNLINIDFSTCYFTGTIYNDVEVSNLFYSEKNINKYPYVEFNILKNNKDKVFNNPRLTYNILAESSVINLNSIVNPTSNLIRVNQNFNQMYCAQINNLMFKINKLIVLTENISNKNIETYQNNTLNEIFIDVKNYYYSSSITLLKKIFQELFRSYNSSIKQIDSNSYSKNICGCLLNNIKNFYYKDNLNYFYTIYNFLYKNDIKQIENFDSPNNLDWNGYTNINNNMQNNVQGILNDISNDISSINIYYTGYVNNNIINSIVYEKEINRLIYILCTNYLVDNSLDPKGIKNDIRTKTLYDIVKLYNSETLINTGQKNKTYLNNTSIYSNQSVFGILNFENMFNNVSWTQNFWVNNIFSKIDSEPEFENSLFNKYLEFVKYTVFFNLDTNKLILNNGIRVIEYFADLQNYDELCSLTFNYMCLNEFYSPNYIFNNIVELNKSSQINSKLYIDADGIKKKIIVYLFFTWIILSNIAVLLSSNIEINYNLVLEYNIRDNLIDVSLKDVLKTENNLEIIKWAIFQIYNMNPVEENKNNTITYLPEYVKNYMDIIYIVNWTKKNCSPIKYFNQLANIYVSSFNSCIGYFDINTTNLYQYNEQSPSLTNLVANFNVVINNDIYPDNPESYNLTFYSLSILGIKLYTRLYDLDNIEFNKSFNSNEFSLDAKNVYTKSQINDFNLLLSLSCQLLNNYNITYTELDNDLDKVLINLRTGTNPPNDLLEIFKGYFSNLEMSVNLISKKGYPYEYFISRIFNINRLSQLASDFNNLSLITPNDFDNFTSILNFRYDYANFFQKYYSYNFNYNNFKENYTVIYKNLFEYYKNIVGNTNAITNVKNSNLYIYTWMFTNIFDSYISTVYYGKNSDNNNYYIDTINLLTKLYFKYNYSFRINGNINNYENLLIQNIYYSVPNLTSWDEIKKYLIGYYYYQLFSTNEIVDEQNYKYDILYFFETLNNSLNVNFYYNLNYLNLIFKFEITIRYLVFQLEQNYKLKINTNQEKISNLSNRFIKYFTNEYTISNFINQKYIETKSNLLNHNLFYTIENCVDKDTFVYKLSKSIGNLIYWVNEFSYKKNILVTWEEYFKDYVYEYYFFSGNQYTFLKTKLSLDDFIFIIQNYINFCLLKKNGLGDFITIELVSLYVDIFTYTGFGNNIYVVEPNVLESLLFVGSYSNTEIYLNSNSNFTEYVELLGLKNKVVILFTNLFLFIINTNWGIIDFNEVDNKPNIKIRSFITYLNYYFTYMNFLINQEKYKNVIVYNYSYYSEIFVELYILYYLIILSITSEYIGFNTNYTLMGNILTNSHKYIQNGEIISTLDLNLNFAVYMDNLNSNIIKNNSIANFYKQIQNNTIYDSISYGVTKFVNNVNNYDYYFTGIFNNQIDVFKISYENYISSNTFYNIINNSITNLTSNVKIYGFNSEIIIGEVSNSFVSNINVHINVLKRIYGGQTNNGVSVSNSYLSNLFNINNYKNNESQITIFTLIYKQIENGIIEDNVLIMLFYYICFITWSTLGLEIKNISYDTKEIFYKLCNLVNRQILLYVNFLTISKYNYVGPILDAQIGLLDNFFNQLNLLLFNNYNNYEFIEATVVFFDYLISNYLQVIPVGQVNNLLGLNQSSWAGSGLGSGSSSGSILKDTNIFNKFNLTLDNYKNSLFPGIPNYILNYTYLIGLAIDYNDSFLIKDIKSINNVYNDIPVQKDLIDYIIGLNAGLTNEYGIIKLINKLQLLFDDELISEYFDYNYKVFVDNFQNINKQKLLDEMMGIKNTSVSYLEQENNIVQGTKPYIKKFLKKKYIIPVKFFFENYSNSIPLITCMYTQINLMVYLNNTNVFKNSFKITNLTNLTIDTSINSDFILVERDERKSLCSKQIDNLIERNNFYQLVVNVNKKLESQTQSDIINLDFDFEFNNLVKELVWNIEIILDNYPITLTQNIHINNLNFTYTNNQFDSDNYKIPGYDFILNTKYYLDGARRDGINKLDSTGTYNYNKITTLLNPYKYNTKVNPNKDYNSYSFALEPTEFQPSGSINMSNYKIFRIQVQINKNKLADYLRKFDILFNLKNLDFKMNITTFEYNLVRYQSGLAGLLFIN